MAMHYMQCDKLFLFSLIIATLEYRGNAISNTVAPHISHYLDARFTAYKIKNLDPFKSSEHINEEAGGSYHAVVLSNGWGGMGVQIY